MTVQEAIAKNRSYRRFYQEEQISTEDLRTIVNAARLSPSGKNVQPLKYYICNDVEMNEEIFQTLGWAGYLTEWPGPEPGERPSAYIIQILDKNIAPGYICDDGITAQSMMLQAVELGLEDVSSLLSKGKSWDKSYLCPKICILSRSSLWESPKRWW